MKKRYEYLSIIPITIETEHPILSTSVVDNSTIESVGHENGASYDFSGSSFNHDWDEGTF